MSASTRSDCSRACWSVRAPSSRACWRPRAASSRVLCASALSSAAAESASSRVDRRAARRAQQLLRLLLGLHADLRRAVGLFDPLTRADLGLVTQLPRRGFGCRDDVRDASGSGAQRVGAFVVQESCGGTPTRECVTPPCGHRKAPRRLASGPGSRRSRAAVSILPPEPPRWQKLLESRPCRRPGGGG